MLNFTRNLIKLRREHPALYCGNFELLTKQPRGVLAYLRHTPEQTILVTLNFNNRPASMENFPDGKWNILFSTNPDGKVGRTVVLTLDHLQLIPHEVLILESA